MRHLFLVWKIQPSLLSVLVFTTLDVPARFRSEGLSGGPAAIKARLGLIFGHTWPAQPHYFPWSRNYHGVLA